MNRPPVRVCFVCSGNICRSPTAEVVLAAVAEDAGLGELIVVDSAGTGGWHEGEDMDRRARATMTDAGYDVPRHRARQFRPADFAERDVVVALDSGHLEALRALAEDAPEPATAQAKIVLLRDHDPQLAPGDDADVPDPYYGDGDGFVEVLAQVQRSCEVLLKVIVDATVQQADKPPL